MTVLPEKMQPPTGDPARDVRELTRYVAYMTERIEMAVCLLQRENRELQKKIEELQN